MIKITATITTPVSFTTSKLLDSLSNEDLISLKDAIIVELRERSEAAENKKLDIPLEDLDVSDVFTIRTSNCLKNIGVTKVVQLRDYTSYDLLKFRNMGKKSITEINEIKSRFGL